MLRLQAKGKRARGPFSTRRAEVHNLNIESYLLSNPTMSDLSAPRKTSFVTDCNRHPNSFDMTAIAAKHTSLQWCCNGSSTFDSQRLDQSVSYNDSGSYHR